jgi:hypothetical protein
MIRPITISLCCVITLCLVLSVAAENGVHPKPVPARPTGTLTGKERLGPKWTDEQRIDNCKVPEDKRGTRPRPTLCPDQLLN